MIILIATPIVRTATNAAKQDPTMIAAVSPLVNPDLLMSANVTTTVAVPCAL
jgi:hypothetical protein